MYQNLVRSTGVGVESVHLEDFPIADPAAINEELSEATRLAMRLSSLGRAARSKSQIKVRQPVSKALVSLRAESESALLDRVSAQVKEELNVKEIEVLRDLGRVAEVSLQADMSKVGPKYGPRTPDVLAALSGADPAEVSAQVAAGQPVSVGEFSLEPDEVVVNTADIEGYSVASEGGYAVAVVTEISRELDLEGKARELVHLVQSMRRSAGFEISDHITTYYQGDEELDEVLAAHGDCFVQETLSKEVVRAEPPHGAHVESHKVNGLDATIGVIRE